MKGPTKETGSPSFLCFPLLTLGKCQRCSLTMVEGYSPVRGIYSFQMHFVCVKNLDVHYTADTKLPHWIIIIFYLHFLKMY
jgi:hypothetical protein